MMKQSARVIDGKGWFLQVPRSNQHGRSTELLASLVDVVLQTYFIVRKRS